MGTVVVAALRVRLAMLAASWDSICYFVRSLSWRLDVCGV
jgi:hypothetical protein